ncbi:MAG TPA: outer membrane lipoprotein-sorting protein [Dongiaceae bacterium]|nr:outer membrane lipoprotein-sorting protein [Dongiaceae bacterium]
MTGSPSFPRTPPFALRTSTLFLALLFPLLACGQRRDDTRPPPLGPEESVREGRRLVDDLLRQKPDANSTNTGVVRIRDAQDREHRIPVKFEIYATPTNWVSVYQTLPADGLAAEELTVVHSGAQPNEYFLARPAGSNVPAARPLRLTADELMVPFAGSDFWVADLGLEFLHWPKQRVLRRELRHSQPCAVLQSVDPHPAAAAYARVDSWVDTDNGGIVHADAYDARGRLIKEFDPSALKKVNGQRQLEEMEMRNPKAGSHTWIKFDLTDQR